MAGVWAGDRGSPETVGGGKTRCVASVQCMYAKGNGSGVGVPGGSVAPCPREPATGHDAVLRPHTLRADARAPADAVAAAGPGHAQSSPRHAEGWSVPPLRLPRACWQWQSPGVPHQLAACSLCIERPYEALWRNSTHPCCTRACQDVISVTRCRPPVYRLH